MNFYQLNCQILQCTKCDICPSKSLNNKIVVGYGNYKLPILCCGEAPGFNEDKDGQPFVGLSGQLLTKIIQHADLNREDLYITNVVKCRPYTQKGKRSSNRPPTETEIENCKVWLYEEIKLFKPKIIIMIGKVPSSLLLCLPANKFKMQDHMTSLIEAPWDVDGYKPLLISCWHPSYLLRKGDKEFQEAVNSFKVAKQALNNCPTEVIHECTNCNCDF